MQNLGTNVIDPFYFEIDLSRGYNTYKRLALENLSTLSDKLKDVSIKLNFWSCCISI